MAISEAFGPLILMIPIPPVPMGVAIAAMVSSVVAILLIVLKEVLNFLGEYDNPSVYSLTFAFSG